jgi:small subunit ribosomal protein S6
VYTPIFAFFLAILNKNRYLCASNLFSINQLFINFMNNYETVFILTPVLSDAQMKEAVEKFKDVLTADGAEIVNEENWGLRKLAYPIQKKSTGFYTLVEFKADPTTIAKLETQFRRDERVLRFLTFRQDKNFAEYAAKRRNKSKEIKKEN